jgi:hypothetical protein
VTPEELRRAAIALFGERGWMSRLAEALGVDRSSVSRWFAGLPVPGPVAAAVTAWTTLHKLADGRPGTFEVPGSGGEPTRETRSADGSPHGSRSSSGR